AFPQLEQEAVQAHAQLQRAGLNLPLEAVYGYLAWQRGVQPSQDQVAAAEHRGAARARVAGNARVETASPAGSSVTQRGGPLTKEAIGAMSTEQLAALVQSHPEWL